MDCFPLDLFYLLVFNAGLSWFLIYWAAVSCVVSLLLLLLLLLRNKNMTQSTTTVDLINNSVQKREGKNYIKPDTSKPSPLTPCNTESYPEPVKSSSHFREILPSSNHAYIHRQYRESKYTSCSVNVFRKSCFYEMWQNMVETRQATDDNMIRRMRFTWWITKTTHLQTYTRVMKYFLLFHCNNGCKNAPQRYVIRTLLVLLALPSVYVLVSPKRRQVTANAQYGCQQPV